MFPRFLDSIVERVLAIAPAVLVSGPRQVGKSTLAMQRFDNYVLMDDITYRASAEEDPLGFVKMLPKPVCIDEIQKVPKLLEAIKYVIDTDRRNGQFLLTGSASVLDMKEVGDTLAGRIVDLRMFPLTSKERNGRLENLFDILLADEPEEGEMPTTDEMVAHIVSGGYPEAVKIEDPRLRAYWFASYISTYIERDVRDIGEIRHLSSFIKLVNVLAARSGGLLKVKELAGSVGLHEATVSNYLTLLEMVYQIKLLPAFSANFSKRFVKSPKLFFTDTGILTHLLSIHTPEQLLSSPHKGLVVETYVFAELLKHIAYSNQNLSIYHYRTTTQKEIDFVIETPKGLLAFEVKASRTIDKSSFKHIVDLRERASRFYRGYVVYLGDRLLPFGERLYALPIGWLG
ncbi:ATP-binding protein [Hydrogenimonas sp.]